CGASSCSPLWTGQTGDFVDGSTPAVGLGFVFVGSGDGQLYVFHADGCGQSVCHPVWTGGSVGAQAAIESSPVLANGVVYVGKNTGQVLEYNANGCGQPFCLATWQGSTNEEPIVTSTPAVVNGTVYIGSGNQLGGQFQGRLYVFE